MISVESVEKNSHPTLNKEIVFATINEDTENHSVSAELDYPAVGSEHAVLDALERPEYHAISDEEAHDDFKELSRAEEIMTALKPAHAITPAKKLAKEGRHETILADRGDEDVGIKDRRGEKKLVVDPALVG